MRFLFSKSITNYKQPNKKSTLVEYSKLFLSKRKKRENSKQLFQGIIGNDNRQYVLDLLRTFPPDVHFIEEAEVSEEAKKLGFPRKHPHKLAALRQELVELFYECVGFILIDKKKLQTSVLAT